MGPEKFGRTGKGGEQKMKLWILVGATFGEINDVAVFLEKKDALIAQQKWNKSYNVAEKISNDVELFEREIETGASKK